MFFSEALFVKPTQISYDDKSELFHIGIFSPHVMYNHLITLLGANNINFCRINFRGKVSYRYL